MQVPADRKKRIRGTCVSR